MKNLLLTAAILAVASLPISAGTLTEPVVEEVMEPEMEAAGSSSTGILVPLLILGAVVALIASNGDDDDDDACNPQIEPCEVTVLR